MVKVKPTASQGRITVRSNNDTTIFGIKDNLSEYYAKLSERWANSPDMVNGIDYSSKYYAEKSKESANKAEIYKNNTLEAIDGFEENMQVAKDDIEQNRINSVNAINNTCSIVMGDMQEKSDEVLTSIESLKAEAVDSINSTKTTILNDIEFVADGEKEEIQELAEKAKDDIESTGFYMRDDKLYFINSKGVEEEFKSGGGSGFNLFDTKISDHVLDGEEAIGWMLQGSYVNGAVYPDFYAKCIEEYNEATETETVNGVTVKVNSNGHKFYDITNKASIDEFYNSLGSAWFYGVDTENERIFLPRDNYFAVKGIAPVVGNGMTLGLTDGVNNAGMYNASGQALGTHISTYGQDIGFVPTGVTTLSTASVGITTDATKSGIEAHLEANENKYLYICVGNTIVNEDQIDVSKVLSEAVLRTSLEQVQVVVETYKNGTSWYRVWSDGWCEQGGETPKTNPDAQQTITFLKQFANTDYYFNRSCMINNSTGSATGYFTGYFNKTTTSVTIQSSNYTDKTSWQACGYIW